MAGSTPRLCPRLLIRRPTGADAGTHIAPLVARRPSACLDHLLSCRLHAASPHPSLPHTRESSYTQPCTKAADMAKHLARPGALRAAGLLVILAVSLLAIGECLLL